MVTRIARVFLLGVICLSIPVNNNGQGSRSRKGQSQGQKAQKIEPKHPQEHRAELPPEAAQREVETLKIDTHLVTVPVIATDINGLYTHNLRRDEFLISEDDVKQEITFFATVSVPFHVVLMLDTSASTQDKLSLIQRAAVAFVEQLQNADRVKVISFDDTVRDLNDFTNDRAALATAILKTRSGQGTKLYDAFELALNSIRRIQGRKAIVLFSDGVDWHSDSASFAGTLRSLDEEGVVVYPIRYNTREETERIARQQSTEQVPILPTIGVIRTPAPGTTAPTFPSDDPGSVPTTGSRSKTGPFGLPLPEEILRRRRETERDRERDRLPRGDRLPPTSDPKVSWPDRKNDPRTPTGTTNRRDDDSISIMLDNLYMTADSYLKELADKSGGRLMRADTLGSLPGAFSNIAAELRTQYSLGYYPTNRERDERYRRIKISTTRKNVIIRARPGYRRSSV